jgi:hypothetical protein
MKIYIDQDTSRFITSPTFAGAVTRFDFKRGDTAKIEIGFVQDGVLVALNGSFSITFGIKEGGKYEGDYLVHDDSFAYNGTTGLYEGTPNFNTTELDELLSVDGDDGNDVPFADCLFEVSATDDDGQASSVTSTARIFNDVNKGNEGVPTDATPAYPSSQSIIDHLADQSGNPHSITIDQAITAGSGVANNALEVAGVLKATGNDLSHPDHALNVGQADTRFTQVINGSTEYKISGQNTLASQGITLTDGTLRVGDLTGGYITIVTTSDLSSLDDERTAVILSDINGSPDAHSFIVESHGIIATNDDTLSGSIAGDHFLIAYAGGAEIPADAAVTSFAYLHRVPVLFTQSAARGGANYHNLIFEVKVIHKKGDIPRALKWEQSTQAHGSALAYRESTPPIVLGGSPGYGAAIFDDRSANVCHVVGSTTDSDANGYDYEWVATMISPLDLTANTPVITIP